MNKVSLQSTHTKKNRRQTIVPVNSEDEFKDAIKKGTGKINLGNCLFIILNSDSAGSFRYRLSLNGKDTTHILGKFPQMSFAEARKKADEMNHQKMLAAEQTKAKRFEENLRTRKRIGTQHRIPTFNNLVEIAKLYKAIRHDYTLDYEMRIVTFLALTTPIYADRIRELRKKDFIEPGCLIFYPDNLYLYSTGALELDRDLCHQILSIQTNRSEYLFEKSQSLRPAIFIEEIEKIINNARRANTIRLTDLKKFFYFICDEKTGFNESFIKEFKANYRKPNWTSKYGRQVHTAINWFANELSLAENAFKDPYISKTNESLPTSHREYS